MRRMVDRLRSQVGESIAEVLVALLISAVGVAMLVGMIGVSARIIDTSTQTMQEEYKRTNITSTEKKQVTLQVGGKSKSFDVMDQKHTYKKNNKDITEVIFYTPAQATSTSSSVSGAS